MKHTRLLPLLLAAVLLPIHTMAVSAAETIITPPCETTLYYSVGTLEVHFDRHYNGATFSVYRSQPEGEFLYYTHDVCLTEQAVLQCELIEGDYKLEIIVPSADGKEYIAFAPISFTIQDPDMDETQSFDRTAVSVTLACDAALDSNTLVTEEPVISDRVVRSSVGFTMARREFMVGDMSGEGDVNASDAARILIDAALVGSGGDSEFTALQRVEADLNGDGYVNASDAAIVLQYSASHAAGNFFGDALEYIIDKMN